MRTCRPALEALFFLSPKSENSFVSNVTSNRVSVSFWYLTFSAACDNLEANGSAPTPGASHVDRHLLGGWACVRLIDDAWRTTISDVLSSSVAPRSAP